MCDNFEKLVWDTYEFENAYRSLGHSIPYKSHATPICQTRFNDLYFGKPFVPPIYLIIINLLIMMFIIVDIMIILMVNVQALKR